MGIYEKRILPWLIHKLCSLSPASHQRQKIVPFAEGRVLEIGIGSGLNLPFYRPSQVTHLWGVDPSPELWRHAKMEPDTLPFSIDWLQAGAEEIPLENNAADSIVMTYTLCSIPDAAAALAEMRRVLKPDGRLYFSEHGLAPDVSVRRLQNRLNPTWRKYGGGCNLNRDIPAILQANGFTFESLESMYIPGWKFASYNFWGVATP